MSDNENKDNNYFEFIKEQVIEKKRKKLKKRLIPLFLTILLAILFGLIAAVTFAVAEPELNKFLNKEEETKEPVSFPTLTPEAEITSIPNESDNTPKVTPGAATQVTTEAQPTPMPVIVEQSIDATLSDFTAMYEQMRQLTYDTNNSLVEISSTFTVTDWLFGTSAEQTSSTTGLIVASNTSDYLVLVSLDRVQDANSIRIKFSDSAYVDAVIQDYETELNIALISFAIADVPKIYQMGLQAANLGESDTIPVGSPIIAVGNPNGYMDSMDMGIVTSRGNFAYITDNRIELFNTNMEFDNSSDGVIVNMNGRVIGWITRTVKDENNEDISTVIGISKLIPIINRMLYQQPHIYFGIIAYDMTIDVKQAYNITSGIYVREVQADSPAFNAGLKSGDIILTINDQVVQNTNNFYNIISSFESGTQVSVKVQRTSGTTQREIILTVTLLEQGQ